MQDAFSILPKQFQLGFSPHAFKKILGLSLKDVVLIEQPTEIDKSNTPLTVVFFDGGISAIIEDKFPLELD